MVRRFESRVEVERASVLAMPAQPQSQQLGERLQRGERGLQLVRDDREELVLLPLRLPLVGEQRLLDAATVPLGLVQARVRDRDRRLRGEDVEDVEVDLVEASLSIARVHVDTADERALVHERHRDHPGELLPLDERRVARRLLLEIDVDVRVEAAIDRLRGLHRDPLRGRVFLAQAMVGDDAQELTGFVDEHHRRGVGGLEQRRGSHDLGQQPVELEDAEHRGGDAVEDPDALGHAALPCPQVAAARSHHRQESRAHRGPARPAGFRG